MNIITKLTPNALTLKVSSVLLSGVIMMNVTASPFIGNGDGDDEQTIDSTIVDSTFLDDLDGSEDSIHLDDWLNWGDDDSLDIDSGEEDEEDDEDWYGDWYEGEDEEDGWDHDYADQCDEEDFDMEDFLAWLEENGFGSEDEYYAYLDSMDYYDIEIEDSMLYFDEEMDDDYEDWQFDSQEDFVDFVYDLGFNCIDDFWAYWEDIEEEWEDIDLEDQGDYDDDYDFYDEIVFVNGNGDTLTLDNLEDHFEDLYGEDFGEDEDDFLHDEEFWNELATFDDYIYITEDGDTISVTDFVEMDLEGEFEDDDYDDGEDEDYDEDHDEEWNIDFDQDYEEDYFTDHEDFLRWMEEMGFTSMEELEAFMAALEEQFGDFGCDVDSTFMEDYDFDEEDMDDEEDLCEVAFDYESDSNIAVFQMMGSATDWMWDFGDGDQSQEATPVHEYEYSGTYAVCLFAYDSMTDCYSEYCDIVDVLVEDDDLCDIELLISEQEDGSFFFDINFDCFNRNQYDVMWQFGDLEKAESHTATHTYQKAQEHQVCASVKMEGEVVSTECQKVTSRAFTSVQDVVAATGTKLYPNPATNSLRFELTTNQMESVQIKITDVLGKNVMTLAQTLQAGNNSMNLNVTNLPNGLYNIQVVNQNINISQQFSVAK